MLNYVDSIFSVQKKQGETLAMLVERIRSEYELPLDHKVTYAGRLDPMAEGEMLILTGQECKRKDLFLGKDKEYEVAILLGLETDTLDMLGLVTRKDFSRTLSKDAIYTAVRSATSIQELPYPEYSSKTINGVPLFVLTRKGEEVVAPKKEVSIKEIEILSISHKKLSEIITDSISVIQKVQGDFRQKEIIKNWNEILLEHGEESVTVLRIRTTVSSGTYMRSLAQWIGQKLFVPALAVRIIRNKII